MAIREASQDASSECEVSHNRSHPFNWRQPAGLCGAVVPAAPAGGTPAPQNPRSTMWGTHPASSHVAGIPNS